jgi:hypothetical protein
MITQEQIDFWDEQIVWGFRMGDTLFYRWRCFLDLDRSIIADPWYWRSAGLLRAPVHRIPNLIVPNVQIGNWIARALPGGLDEFARVGPQRKTAKPAAIKREVAWLADKTARVLMPTSKSVSQRQWRHANKAKTNRHLEDSTKFIKARSLSPGWNTVK